MLRRICKLLGFSYGDFQANTDGNYVFAQGDTVPTDGTSGYAVGCVFLHRDGGSGTAVYVNEGSESSCDFNAIASVAADQTLSGAVDVTGGFSIGGTAVAATAAEINNAADVSARVQELTASGAVTAGVQSVELNHASAAVAATIADASNHQGLFIVKDTSASGTAAHTLTLTSGTFNGTNNVATLNAPNEALVVYFDSAGNGTIVENVGAVALS